MRASTMIGSACIALGAGIAVNSLLGPLGLKVIEYRTAETALNQLKGADLASLAVVAPASLAAGWMWLRRHPLAPIASLAPAAYASYTFTQAILGVDYGRYEGNNEKFFPLHLALVVSGGAIAIRSWTELDARVLPPLSKRLRKTAAFTLLGSAAFLTLGLHVPGLLAVWRGDPPAEYVDAPATFWVVKLMDLGIIVPAAVAAGAALLRGSPAAQRATYGLTGVLALIGASVAAMAAVMQVNDDPSASPVFTAGFGVITVAFAVLALRLGWSAMPDREGAEAEGSAAKGAGLA